MKRLSYKISQANMLFHNVPSHEQEALLTQIKPIKKEYLRGEVIFREGDLCTCIAIINRGAVKATKNFSDGHEKIIRLLEQQDFIGISLIFSSNPFYKGTFIAETLSTVTLISKNDLYYLMQKNSQILQNVLASISDFAINLNNHIKLLSYKTIRQKICAFLYEEYTKNLAQTFVVCFTKTDLAAFLNVERPSLSIEISKLIKDGIIANQNKLYTILNLSLLEQEL